MRSSNPRRWTVLWVLGFVAATAMGFQGAPSEEAEPPPAVLEIIEQSPSVAEGESFTIRVAATGLDPADITVNVEVFPAAEGLEPQLDPGDREPVLSSDDEDAAAEVLVSANGFLTVRIPVGADAADGELTLPGPGLYPLRLSLTDGNGAMATATTTLLHRPQPGFEGPAIVVGLVLDVGAGALDLAQATEILGANPELTPTIVVHRDAVAELERDEEARNRFRDALGRRTVIVGTSNPLDPSSLVEAGQADAYRLAHQQMRERMEAIDLPVEPRAIIIDAPLTAGGVDLLAELGVSTAIAHRLATSGAGEPWPVTSGMVGGSQGPMFVLGTDVGRLSATAAVAETEVAQGHRLLAHLAVADSPTLVGELARMDDPIRSAALLADPTLATAWTLLPITDARLQRQTSGSVVALREAPAQDLGPAGPALGRIEELLSHYGDFHADGPRSPGHYRAVLMEAFRLDVSPATRSDTLGRIESELIGAFQQITLPGNQSVTLAAQAAPLPVAVENSADGARFVRVQVTSDKITMAEPDLILRVEPGVSAVDVPVRTRSLGASPLTVTMLTPDGSQVLSTTRFQVRSTAVPGLGLLISALGLGALLAWWYFSLRRSGRGSGDDGGGSDRPDDDPGPRPDHGQRPEPGDADPSDGLPGESGPIDLRPDRVATSTGSAKRGVRVGDSV